MKHTKFFVLPVLILAMLAPQRCVSVVTLENKKYDLEMIFSGKFKPEFFYGKSISWLNDDIDWDRVIYNRHTLDFDLDVIQGKDNYSVPVAEFKTSVRDRAVWGNPSSIASVTESVPRIGGTPFGGHKHFLPRHIFWLREGWLRLVLNEIVGLSLAHEHTVTVGAFSFQLGRGITLGDAYAVAPEMLGFYSDSMIDQYAFGGKLSGEFVDDTLLYDFYVGIVQNKSDSTSNTGDKIFGQEFGRRDRPQRGFGSVDFVAAGRLMWHTFNNEDLGHLTFEPYWMYNHAPEQKVQFTADASSEFGSLGLASEYVGNRFEFGFDTAMNFGSQQVKGWDRNQTEIQNRNGQLVYVNSHVLLNASPLADSVPSKIDSFKAPNAANTISAGVANSIGKDAQTRINGAAQGESTNGALIGSAPGLTDLSIAPVPTQVGVTKDQLYNAINRFRDPYTNKYIGWMFVADAAYWIYHKELQVAATAGIATGDENPNEETKDGDYAGFVSVQELYSGKRVKSAFVMGANRLVRPLSQPLGVQAPGKFPNDVRGFTNLIFTGCGLKWTPQDWEHAFTFNPNLLAYWQDAAHRKFNLRTKKDDKSFASTFLGVETNLFMNYKILKNLEFFFVGSVFVPGSHFDDIRGKPLNEDQKSALDSFTLSNCPGQPVPNVGTDFALTLNFGLEYKF